MNQRTTTILLNIGFCLLCCILGLIDNINSVEYIYNAQFHSIFLKACCFIFIIVHPIILLFYNIITLSYLSYLSEHQFSELTKEEEYHEMIYFREKVKHSFIWILPLSIYLSILTYFKFFSLYSLKFLIEKPGSVEIFRNVITTTLHHAVIIQCVFQSVPQIILQAINNLLIMEDKHDLNFRGVFNFSTLFSLAFISTLVILYYREKKSKDDLNNEEKDSSKLII
jgi:hypothetical protein